jgi:hypothetical protein
MPTYEAVSLGEFPSHALGGCREECWCLSCARDTTRDIQLRNSPDVTPGYLLAGVRSDLYATLPCLLISTVVSCML